MGMYRNHLAKIDKKVREAVNIDKHNFITIFDDISYWYDKESTTEISEKMIGKFLKMSTRWTVPTLK